MFKGYYVNIPPTLAEVLADIGSVSEDAEFDTIVNAAYQDFFSFYSPRKISAACAADLEKFVLHFFIMRRVGSGNIRKFKQIFRNKWNSIIPYYERILETEENESDYFTNPILSTDISGTSNATGTRDQQKDTTRNADTDFTTQRQNTHSGSFTESNSNTEINRYSDTPQGDSSDIWETYTDSQGQVHVRLGEVYLTDIRGITDSGSRSGSDQATDNMNGHDVTDLDETVGETIDEDTTHQQTDTKTGYDGKSPAELMEVYRNTFLRTYENIVAELTECFYNLVEVDDLIDFV